MIITKLRLNDDTYDLGAQPDWDQTNPNAPDYIRNKPVISTIDSYPIGSIYFTIDANFDPAERFGGVWERIEGRFLFGADTNHPLGSRGGAERVTLTSEQMPKHRHTITSITTTASGKHTHTLASGTAAEAGNHKHTASGSSNKTGAHTHSTTSAGSHSHSAQGFHQVNHGSQWPCVAYEGKITGDAAGTTSINAAGAHTHTANSAGDHSHTITVTVNNGGAHTHSVTGTTTESSTHTHTVSGNTDYDKENSASSHENMPPYLAVYMWQRVE